MKTLNFTIRIDGTPQHVWNVMLDPASYRHWAKAFSPNSQFEGEWKQGAFITFIDPDMGGTKALLEAVSAPRRIHVRHVAIVNKDGSEDTQSDVARKWLGITETYTLRGSDDFTDLGIDIFTHEDYEEMFSSCWPEALIRLKQACEAG